MMCERCVTVAPRVREIAQELIEQFPATDIDGFKVPKGHHVAVAFRVVAEELFQQTMEDARKLRDSMTPEELAVQEEKARDIAQRQLAQNPIAQLLQRFAQTAGSEDTPGIPLVLGRGSDMN
jgi:hypothetical protein